MSYNVSYSGHLIRYHYVVYYNVMTYDVCNMYASLLGRGISYLFNQILKDVYRHETGTILAQPIVPL